MTHHIEGAGAGAQGVVCCDHIALLGINRIIIENELEFLFWRLIGVGLAHAVVGKALHGSSAAHAEIHSDGIHRGKGDQGGGVAGAYQRADGGLVNTDAPGERRGDGGIAQVDFRLVHRRLHLGHGGICLAHGCLIGGHKGFAVCHDLVGNGSRGGFSELDVALQVLAAHGELGFRLRACSLGGSEVGPGFIQGGLVGRRADGEEHISLLHQGAILEMLLEEEAAHLGADVGFIHTAQRAEPGACLGHILLEHLADFDREGRQGGRGCGGGLCFCFGFRFSGGQGRVGRGFEGERLGLDGGGLFILAQAAVGG